MPLSSRGMSIIRLGLALRLASQSKQIVTEIVTAFDEHQGREISLCARSSVSLIARWRGLLLDNIAVAAIVILPLPCVDILSPPKHDSKQRDAPSALSTGTAVSAASVGGTSQVPLQNRSFSDRQIANASCPSDCHASLRCHARGLCWGHRRLVEPGPKLASFHRVSATSSEFAYPAWRSSPTISIG